MSVVPGECYIFTNLLSTAYKGWGLVFIVSGENHQDPTFQRCTLHLLSQSLPLWLVSHPTVSLNAQKDTLGGGVVMG